MLFKVSYGTRNKFLYCVMRTTLKFILLNLKYSYTSLPKSYSQLTLKLLFSQRNFLIFCDIASYSPLIFNSDVSEEHVAFIFKIEE
jgi:hypothetical protein